MDLAEYTLDWLREDSEFVLYRGRQADEGSSVLVLTPSARIPEPSLLQRMEREMAMSSLLDPTWSVCPRSIKRHAGRAVLLLDDPGGPPLDSILGKPLELRRFLAIALGMAASIRHAHSRGLVHKDIRPANFFFDKSGDVRLSGFGYASRLLRERQDPSPPKVIAGTLEYMAPEQTGRVNRSIDTRSDLYSLGISLYEILVGRLPFSATSRMELVHCHIARQPPPPSASLPDVPRLLEALILKLLAKNADDRYQTAAGVEHDLGRCLDDVEAHGVIRDFALAQQDTPDRLLVPEKLYGRDAVLKTLSEAFDDTALRGQFKIVLVSGHSGVGKSATITEFLRTLYPTSGLFASGKFDQYKRDVPYATLAAAFQALLRQILSYEDAGLALWRALLQNAVEDCGKLMVDLIPDLGLILGEQATLAPLSGQDEKRRFSKILRRFIGVFAQAEHPLVLFLDDLQWLDTATLDLLERICTEEEIPHLLLICAYRANEVESSPALRRTLDTIRVARGVLREIQLEPLAPGDIERLVADTLRDSPANVRDVSEIIFLKTQGNPFFAVQILTALEADGLIAFDHESASWRCDTTRMRIRETAGNVMELLTERLLRQPDPTLSVLKQLAWLGNSVHSTTLSEVAALSQESIDIALSDCVATGLVHRVQRGYAFSHDGVRDAAYGLVPESERAAEHIRIGRLLLSRTGQADLEDSVFEIVRHFNRALPLINLPGERRRIAELNLMAGRRAKAAAAYEAALRHFEASLILLPDDHWEHDYRLAFDLTFHRADCKFMVGDVDYAQDQLAMLAERSTNSADFVSVVDKQVMLAMYLCRLDRAVEISLASLARMGMPLPPVPSKELIDQEYRHFRSRADILPIERLLALPRMQDRGSRELMIVLAGMLATTGAINLDLQALVILRMINLSLDHGNTEETAHAYACLAGLHLGWRLGSFDDVKKFILLARRLVDEAGFGGYLRRVFSVISGTGGPWCLSLKDCIDLAHQATQSRYEPGGIDYAGYAWQSGLAAMLASGKNLADVDAHGEAGWEFSRIAHFALQLELIGASQCLIRALRGSRRGPRAPNGEEMDEVAYERYLESNHNLWHALVRYRIRVLQRNIYFWDLTACLRLIQQLEGQAEILKVFELAEYRFCSAIARAAALRGPSTAETLAMRAPLMRDYAQLVEWSSRCPETFADRVALVAAEIARTEDRPLDAEQLYERAIALSREQGQVHNEALAHELAARFYLSRGLEFIATTYLHAARACYLAWGADGKVQQLDRDHLGRSDESRAQADLRLADEARLQHFDLTTVVEMSQAVSSEIVFERLIERLMTTVIKNAGAVRGVLLLPRHGELQVVAEAVTNDETISVTLCSGSDLPDNLPHSVLKYVSRAREVVLLDDALHKNNRFSDAYILRAQARSVLCLPLIKQKHLVGVLYLENNLLSHMFTPSRVSVLQLLASQAAISIENAELFSEGQRSQEEARLVSDELRRSFDLIPALAWRASPDGAFEFANRQWHDYTGVTPEEARGENWLRSFHPDDMERAKSRWRQLLKSGIAGEFEARIRRHDGEVRRFLVRATPVRDDRGQILNWHGTNTDIENLKRVEQAQEALARATRITAMGELTVSIVHEISQPLTAMASNAEACVRWLADDQSNVPRARAAAQRIIGDGRRATQVIDGIRALARKSPQNMASLNLHEVITEVIALTRNQMIHAGILAEVDLAPDVGTAKGVRVQLQQVVLNLVINAIEAMSLVNEQSRRLKIGTQRWDREHMVVSVADTGPGLDPAITERVFEAFFTTKSEGLGIGLSVCRSIVEAHGGKLWASPHAPQGTIFRFTVASMTEAPPNDFLH